MKENVFLLNNGYKNGKNTKKIILYVLLIITMGLFTSCIPGRVLRIKNIMNENIILNYSIRDDLLIDGFKKNNIINLSTNDETDIIFSWTKFYSGDIFPKNNQYTSTFLEVFDDISITLLSGNKILTKTDIEKYIVKYKKEGVSTHVFTLEIVEN
ncbi:hypothetical protein FACS189485_17210 [Spirochaetia bacterium]|nr:hypothetical protein FACS189485_17210 [Spirochaetia bacterium]